VAKGLVSVTPW